MKTAGWAAYSSLAGREEEARPLYEDLVARYPRSPGVHLAFGLFLAARGSEEALPLFNREVQLFPDNARAHLEIAFYHLERGDAADALPSAEASVRLAPDVYTSHLALGQALVARDAVQRGIEELEEAARLGPEVSDVYVALAQAYAAAGRTADVDRARREAPGAGRRKAAPPEVRSQATAHPPSSPGVVLTTVSRAEPRWQGSAADWRWIPRATGDRLLARNDRARQSGAEGLPWRYSAALLGAGTRSSRRPGRTTRRTRPSAPPRRNARPRRRRRPGRPWARGPGTA